MQFSSWYTTLLCRFVLLQVGGQVALRGMPAGGRTPSWLRLAATIKKGDRSLLVEGNVRGRWQAGAKIGVAPTSFFVNQTELKIIRGCEY